MPRTTIDCPVCKNERVNVWWGSLEGAAYLTDSDSACECRESKLVDMEQYDAALLHEAQENYDGAPLHSESYGGDPREAPSYVNATRDAGRLR